MRSIKTSSANHKPPYSITFLVLWTLFLLAYWALGFPLGLQASYEYVPM